MTNNSTDKYWKWAIAALVIYNLISLCQYLPSCGRNDKNREKSEEPRSSEKQLQRTVNVDSIKHAAYLESDAKHLARIKALQRDSAEAKSKDRQQTEKARQSALKYAETGKHEDCSTALTDCQGENETKAFALAVQERMLAGYDSASRMDKAEIDRINSVKDTLSKGWAEANRKLAKKPFKVYATAAFEQQPVTNNASLGATATFDRWLFGYQKGVIQNTHEIKAGVLIRLKR